MNFTREERKSVKFAHFQLGHFGERKDGSPIRAHATVASIEKEGRYYYGVALCAPDDNFCREDGRLLARAKLMCSEQAEFTTGCIYELEPVRNSEMALIALKEVLSRIKIPNRDYRWYFDVDFDSIQLKSRKVRK